ncbi:hypothetical protein COEX109129_30415 [Corallococcus exiguus]
MLDGDPKAPFNSHAMPAIEDSSILELLQTCIHGVIQEPAPRPRGVIREFKKA